ncbi:MAG TPA: class I SAM-dependent methyltransferase [Jatrophihabitans sp.]|nr:class I SAM-dependent methyltransferase [Jatrophihabitans sp.]
MDRVEKALHALDLSGRGLEIGPSYNPLVSKASGHRIETVDHADQAELIAKYRGMNLDQEQLARIEPVDHLWTGGSLLDVISDHGGYDYIIASHFIEHTVDLIRFLKDCQVLLRDGGLLSLVVPDKRFCFDRFQPLSTVGDVLDAANAGYTFHSPGPLVDHQAYACTSGGALIWSADYHAPLQLQFDNLAGAAEALENGLAQKEYFDTHRWKFTPASFDLLIADLADLGQHDFGVLADFPTEGFEFFVTLVKGGARHEPRNRIAALQHIEAELAEAASPIRDGVSDERVAQTSALRAENQRLAAELAELRASTSWRVTAPLRAASDRLRAARTRRRFG